MFYSRTRYLTKVGILSAIGVILMFFEVPVPMLPSFLKLDASELPAILGAFVLGPWAGVFIELIKNLLHLSNTHTMGIGEMANFFVGISFVAPAGYFYRKHNSHSGAVLALAAATITMTLSASILNYFILLPLYQTVLHFPLDKIITLGTAANPHIIDLASFITLAIVPFNLLKGIIISIFTLLLYKNVAPILFDE